MRQTVHKNEQGMVSIIVTLIMILIISLIVLGLGQITRRNQREALNNQLAAQAYYAAETGVNDAMQKLKDGYQPTPTDATNCTSFMNATTGGAQPLPKTLDGTNVGYTCVLVNTAPKFLSANVIKNSPVVIPISPVGSGGSGTRLQFSWPKPTGASVGGCQAFQTQAAWGNCPPVLRMDLYADDGNYAADHMATQTATVFFVPDTNAPPTMVQGGSTYVLSADCTSSDCASTLKGINNATFTDNHHYYARLSSIYGDAGTVYIRPTAAGTTFPDSQIVIDVTGHAQNQLKRIQEVFQPTEPSDLLPNALSSANGICKVFSIAQGVDLGNGVGYPDGTPGDCY